MIPRPVWRLYAVADGKIVWSREVRGRWQTSYGYREQTITLFAWVRADTFWGNT